MSKFKLNPDECRTCGAPKLVSQRKLVQCLTCMRRQSGYEQDDFDLLTRDILRGDKTQFETARQALAQLPWPFVKIFAISGYKLVFVSRTDIYERRKADRTEQIKRLHDRFQRQLQMVNGLQSILSGSHSLEAALDQEVLDELAKAERTDDYTYFDIDNLPDEADDHKFCHRDSRANVVEVESGSSADFICFSLIGGVFQSMTEQVQQYWEALRLIQHMRTQTEYTEALGVLGGGGDLSKADELDPDCTELKAVMGRVAISGRSGRDAAGYAAEAVNAYAGLLTDCCTPERLRHLSPDTVMLIEFTMRHGDRMIKNIVAGYEELEAAV